MKDNKPLSALQEWVMEISIMQQTVLMSALRGADGINKNHTYKLALRWYRRSVLISAFDKKALLDPYLKGGGDFTGPLHEDISLKDMIELYYEDVDDLPMHFHTHLLSASQIIGYKHHDELVRDFWNSFYLKGVKKLHLKPETEEEMDYRLSDSREKWLEKSK